VPSPEFDLVVIGGGSGGLVVAAGGATLGAKVALIEKHKMGGDCLWYGCVPSKTLIKSARIAYQMRNADRWSIPPAQPNVELAAVMERVAAVIRSIEPNDSPERFRGLGVDVIHGAGPLRRARHGRSQWPPVDRAQFRDRDRIASRRSADTESPCRSVSDQRNGLRTARGRSAIAGHRRRPDRLRVGAGIPQAGQRGRRRRYRAGDPAEGGCRRGGRSCSRRCKAKGSASISGCRSPAFPKAAAKCG
jgi:glycine/D-amino acid oxidase-like deaminating enzyme